LGIVVAPLFLAADFRSAGSRSPQKTRRGTLRSP